MKGLDGCSHVISARSAPRRSRKLDLFVMSSFIESGFTTKAEWLASGGGGGGGQIFLTYFPIAGRGELTRLIAAAGGVELTESPEVPAGDSKAAYFSPSGVPLLKHGDFKMSQSGAIEAYISNIAPKFSGLTMQERAIDAMYSGIKEEMLFNCAKAIFTTKNASDVVKLCDKWFALFQANLPDDGFVHGLSFPTGADCVVLNITTGYSEPASCTVKESSCTRAVLARASACARLPQWLLLRLPSSLPDCACCSQCPSELP